MDRLIQSTVTLLFSFCICINAAIADINSDAERIFDWAETTYADLFWPAASTQTIPGWRFRYYSGTDTYTGVSDGSEVAVLGGAFGNSITTVGSVSDMLALIPNTPSVQTFRDTLQDATQGPEMVVIPAGSFRMGDIQGSGYYDETPVHDVTISAFAMGTKEVTFAEYDKFAEATGGSKPYDRGWGRGDRSVINVSWNDAQAYVAWLSEQTGQTYRLPTEAEWEYAARAGTETTYWWGNDIDCSQADVFYDCNGYGTSPVGSYAANAFGLFDVHGNVFEWVQDWYDDYSGQAQTDPQGPNCCTGRVYRGGSWWSNASYSRVANRSMDLPGRRYYLLGFRLARTL